MILEFIILTSLGLLGYSWLVYPSLLWVMAKGQGVGGKREGGVDSGQWTVDSKREGVGGKREEGVSPQVHRTNPLDPEDPNGSEEGFPPKADAPVAHRSQVSLFVLIAAHNEEDVIGRRIENVIESFASISFDWRLLVGSDGSGDRTAEMARKAAEGHDNIHVFDFKERRGKVAVLKDLVREVDSGQRASAKPVGEDGWTVDGKGGVGLTEGNKGNEVRCSAPLCENSRILIFTDANTDFQEGAIEKLLGHFDDPEIGGVCGKLEFREEAGSEELGAKSEECLGKGEEERGMSHAHAVAGSSTENAEAGGENFSRRWTPIQADGGRDGVSPSVEQESSKNSVENPASVADPATVEDPATAWAPSRENSPSPLQISGFRSQVSSFAPEGFYWRMENWLKQKESDLDSCLGANGAIYAIRSELFWSDIPANTIVDDFVIGMKVRESGKKMVYEPDAIAVEEFPEVTDEWKRRVRIGAGDYQALGLCRRCLLPSYGSFAWSFFSHKVLRWFTPHMMLLILISSFTLMVRRGNAGGMSISNVQFILSSGVVLSFVAFFVMALAGKSVKRSDVVLGRLLRLCDHFLTMQEALFVGFLKYCKGGLKGAWERTGRRGKPET